MRKLEKLHKLADQILTLRYGTSNPTSAPKIYLTHKQIASYFQGVSEQQVRNFI